MVSLRCDFSMMYKLRSGQMIEMRLKNNLTIYVCQNLDSIACTELLEILIKPGHELDLAQF